MVIVTTHSPPRIREYTRRPQFVKTRKSTGLDKSAGAAYSSGYAMRGMCAVSESMIVMISLAEGGIVQNMPSEARARLMGPFNILKCCTRVPDYFAETTGRPNNLGSQSQDNCMLLRSSQRMIPPSIGLVLGS